MSRYYAYLLLLLTLVSPAIYAAEVNLQIKGLDDQLESNVQARIEAINKKDITDSGSSKNYIATEIRKGLRALGYYNPTISFELQYKDSPAKSNLIAYVDAGEPVLIVGTTINFSGSGTTDKDYIDLLATGKPTIGDVLDHGVYESFKSSLNKIALGKGYFDAEMTKNELAVADKLRQAYWFIDFNTGQRYRFGAITFGDSNIREDYLRNLVPFKEGDYYTSEDLAALNRRLSSTNWFSSVVVTPQFDKSTPDHHLPLDVNTTPRRRNSIDLGLGYSTDVGVRGTSTWTRPWLNSKGHSLKVNTALSSPEQSLDFNYHVPLLKAPLEQYYVLQLGLKRQNDSATDTEADSYSFNVARYWDLPTGWQRSINLRWSYDNFTQGDDSYHTMLLYPGVNFSRIRQQGGLMPSWGDSQRYSLDVSDTLWGSDINFIAFQAQNIWIRTYADYHRFILRGNFGFIETGQFDKVPPSLRFFAGGDRSIRGYSYKTISPKDDKGKLTGASRLLLGSFEYQYNIHDAWWGAAFIDSGEAVKSFREQDFKTGAGVGIRWASPFGPVKLDVASPVNNGKSSVHLYFGIGAEL